MEADIRCEVDDNRAEHILCDECYEALLESEYNKGFREGKEEGLAEASSRLR